MLSAIAVWLPSSRIVITHSHARRMVAITLSILLTRPALCGFEEHVTVHLPDVPLSTAAGTTW